MAGVSATRAREEEKVKELMEKCVPNAFAYLNAVNLNLVRALRIARRLCLEGRPGCPEDFQERACASYIDLAMARTHQLLEPVETGGRIYIEMTNIDLIDKWLGEVDPDLARPVTSTIRWLEGLLGRLRQTKIEADGPITTYTFGDLDPETSARVLERARELVLARMEAVFYASIPRDLYEASRRVRERARLIADLPPLPPHPGKEPLEGVEERVREAVREIVEEERGGEA